MQSFAIILMCIGAAVAYGINADDTSDFRPGQRAAKEHRVLTTLLDVELHKAEIRYLAQTGHVHFGVNGRGLRKTMSKMVPDLFQ